MAITVVTSTAFGFADGNAGHVCNLGSSPSVGDWDFLFVNSDTVVSTPSGFSATVTAVNNQGSYIFSRKAVGGEGSTVTVTTSGNFNCSVILVRLAGANAIDIANSTQANASIGGATPAHSTGALAQTNEAVLAFGAMHAIQTANQNNPVWSAGFSPLQTSFQGTGASGVLGYVGWKTPAGTAAESPQVSWSGDGVTDRYMLTVSATEVTGAPTVTGSAVADLGPLTGLASGLVEVPGTGLATLGPLTGTASGLVEVSATASANLGALTAHAQGTTPARTSPIQHLDDLLAAMLACLCEAAATRPRPPEHCCYRIGEEVAHDADVYTDLCCEGLAYVSLGDVYPVVDSFPEQSIVTQANQVCSFPSWAVNIKAGIVRCIPTGTTNEMPSCTDWNTAMVQHIFDTQSLASAACCFKQAWISDIEPGMSVVIGPNSTTTPQGGCVERFITLQVQTSVCPAC